MTDDTGRTQPKHDTIEPSPRTTSQADSGNHRPLTAKRIKAEIEAHTQQIEACPDSATQKKLYDQKGLFLLLTAAGSASWRFKYRYGGKERSLSLGLYPDVSLKEAREATELARIRLRSDVDPSAERRKAKQEAVQSARTTFRIVAEDWIQTKSADWEPKTRQHVEARLRRYAFPALGAIAVAAITTPDVRAMLKGTEAVSVDTAHRVRSYTKAILQFAIDCGLIDFNVAQSVPLSSHTKRHRSAITDPTELAGLLRAIRTFPGSPQVHVALQLAPYVFVRPGELRRMEWSELRLSEALWVIPASKMKSRRDHIVPLASQGVELIRQMEGVTGHRQYVFAGLRNPNTPLSDNALNAALRSLGYDGTRHVAHGFRATARTLLDEKLGYRWDIIEHQLAHAVPGPNGAAYNRTTHLEARTGMMQAWADYLDGLANFSEK